MEYTVFMVQMHRIKTTVMILYQSSLGNIPTSALI